MYRDPDSPNFIKFALKPSLHLPLFSKLNDFAKDRVRAVKTKASTQGKVTCYAPSSSQMQLKT